MPETLRERISRLSDRPHPQDHLTLGYRVTAGRARPDLPLVVPHARRPEHLAILGKTGTGKSSLLRFLCEQDIREDRGFVFFDLHGDLTPVLASVVAEEEMRRGEDLSRKFLVFDPADRDYSIGLNVLAATDEQQRYVQLAEVTQLLRDRWHLEALGPRTEELLRNSLQVLHDNGLTLIELHPLLTDASFRNSCLAATTSLEARAYFTYRYGRLSAAAQAEYREAVLNKITVFTGDPHFRHLLGQAGSAIRLTEIIEGRYWLIFNLDRGRLGSEAATVGSLLLSRLKHALFGRQTQELLTLYCDELQNLVAWNGGLDNLLAEARKLGVSVCSANQYLGQFPPHMQHAVLAVGTLIFFQLSGPDARTVARELGGDSHLAWQLRNLPPRQIIQKSAPRPLRRGIVPELRALSVGAADLLQRSRGLWATKRSAVEEEIALRTSGRGRRDVLDGWE